MKRLTINDCILLISIHGGKCISTKYINNKTKLLIRCNNEHLFYMNISSINNGQWCPSCAGNKKLTLQDAIMVAEGRCGRCLSKQYINAHIKLLWECQEKHIWCAALDSVKNNNTWCPECKKNKLSNMFKLKNGLLLAHEIANKFNGRCLSIEYINNSLKLIWECQEKHIWSASLSSVKDNNTFCPECKLYKTQNKLKCILEKILNSRAKSNFKNFEWLKNPKTKKYLEVDIWFPDLKLAIEYDGEQHFKSKKYFGGKTEFNKIKERDKIKNKLIAEHSNEISNFLRFSYKDEISEINIKSNLQKNGILI